jgi:hypothetical protein
VRHPQDALVVDAGLAQVPLTLSMSSMRVMAKTRKPATTNLNAAPSSPPMDCENLIANQQAVSVHSKATPTMMVLGMSTTTSIGCMDPLLRTPIK